MPPSWCILSGRTPAHYGTANATESIDKSSANPTFLKLDNYLDNLAAAATYNRSTLQPLLDTYATLMASWQNPSSTSAPQSSTLLHPIR